MKRQDSLFKNYSEFQNSDHRPLNQVQGPSKCRVLCDCSDYTPTKLTLSLGSKVLAHIVP